MRLYCVDFKLVVSNEPYPSLVAQETGFLQACANHRWLILNLKKKSNAGKSWSFVLS